jgi:flagellar basal-body rod protein FlgF
MAYALDIAQVGMTNDLQRLQVISHNLANAGTTGFRRDIAVTGVFEQQLASRLAPAASAAQTGGSVEGLTVQRVVDSSAGVLRYTGNPLDVAIEGDGYMELVGSQGTVYSRRGALTLDPAGRLVGPSGMVVVGLDGEIRLTSGEPRIDADGRVWQGDDLMGQIKVVNFGEPGALQRLGSGLYANLAGVEAEPAAAPTIRQGHLESSNVRVMDEMVRLIDTMRHFEINQRVAKSYDEMLSTSIRTIAEF